MKVWLNKLRKFISLTWEEKSNFLQAAYALIYISILLRVLNFAKFKSYFKKFQAYNSTNLNETKYKEAIQKAAQIVPSTFTCLPQALAFKQQFSNSKLVIGVQPSHKKRLDAHAWVERDGQILIGEVPNFEYLPLWIWE